MPIPVKKLKNGFEIPVYGLGTWQMGGRESRDLNNDDQADIRAIKNAIDLGVTHIDTAESYANGYTEILVGKAIKNYQREKLFLVSKVKAIHLKYDDLITSCKASLERLQTAYLDLYLIHLPNPDIPIKETMKAMDTLFGQGLIKNIGVSNFTTSEIEEAQSSTNNKIVACQLHLNLKFREPERKGILQYCQEHDMILIAWRPLQKGVLLEDKENMVVEMAEKYHKTPAQIAINWLISQDNVVTLSKTNDIEHLKENLGAIGWEMDKEDIEKLRNNYPNQEAVSDAVPLR